MLTKSLIFVFVALLLSNCTIHKRQVNRGYFVQWHHFDKKTELHQDQTESLSGQVKLHVYQEDSGTCFTNSTDQSLRPIVFTHEKEAIPKIEPDKTLCTDFTEKFDNERISRIERQNDPKNEVLKAIKNRPKPGIDKKSLKKFFWSVFFSLVSFGLWLFTLFITLMPTTAYPGWLYSILLPILILIFTLSILFFAVMAIIYLVKAFRKPKSTTTT